MALSLERGWACDSCHDSGNEAVVTTKERSEKAMKFLLFTRIFTFAVLIPMKLLCCEST